MDFAAVLRHAGCQVVETDGWRARGRSGLVPEGVLLHHTASAAGSRLNTRLLIEGRPDLSGPLVQLGLDRQGVFYVIAAGIAHHAGEGSSRMLGRIRQGLPPLGDAAVVGLRDDYDGNPHWVGIEIDNNGIGEPYTPAQWDALHRGVPALLHAMGKGSYACAGHKEHTKRKIDPSFDMPAFRLSLAAPSPPAQSVVLPPLPPPITFGDDMLRTPARINLDANGGWTVVAVPFEKVVSVLVVGGPDYSYQGAFEIAPDPAGTKVTLAEPGNPGWIDVVVWAVS